MAGTTVEMGQFIASNGATTTQTERSLRICTGFKDNGVDRFKTREYANVPVALTQHSIVVASIDFPWISDGSLNQFGNLETHHTQFLEARNIQLFGHYGFLNLGDEKIRYEILYKITALETSDLTTFQLPKEIPIAMSSVGPDASFLNSVPALALFAEICAKANIPIPTLIADDSVMVVHTKRTDEESRPYMSGSFVIWKEQGTLYLETDSVTETQYRLHKQGRQITDIQIQIA